MIQREKPVCEGRSSEAAEAAVARNGSIAGRLRGAGLCCVLCGPRDIVGQAAQLAGC